MLRSVDRHPGAAFELLAGPRVIARFTRTGDGNPDFTPPSARLASAALRSLSRRERRSGAQTGPSPYPLRAEGAGFPPRPAKGTRAAVSAARDYPLGSGEKLQLFCAFCPRCASQRTLWDGNRRRFCGPARAPLRGEVSVLSERTMTAHQRLEVRIPMALEAYADHARDLVVIQTVAPPHACRSLRSPQLRGDARAVPTGSDQRADPALPPPQLDEARQTPIGFVVRDARVARV